MKIEDLYAVLQDADKKRVIELLAKEVANELRGQTLKRAIQIGGEIFLAYGLLWFLSRA